MHSAEQGQQITEQQTTNLTILLRQCGGSAAAAAMVVAAAAANSDNPNQFKRDEGPPPLAEIGLLLHPEEKGLVNLSP